MGDNLRRALIGHGAAGGLAPFRFMGAVGSRRWGVGGGYAVAEDGAGIRAGGLCQ